MKLTVGETIRTYRKGRGMTQEQLAEAVGVSVGAVSKWESGLSHPDIAMLPELAALFEISVDVLLGYEQPWKNAERAAGELRQYRLTKRYETGMEEAEKALARFPNCFAVVHESAKLYQLAGIELGRAPEQRRALALFQRACGLIGQNDDPDVSGLSLQVSIGEAYQTMGETELALRQYIRSNDCGVNNGRIGYLLSQQKRYAEALPYLSDKLIDCVMELFRATVGFANCFANGAGDDAEADDVMQWMCGVLGGLKKPGQSSYLDKAQVMLLGASAQAAAVMGDEKRAEEYLRRAATLARAFDAAPDYSARGIRFCLDKDRAIADDFGESAMTGLEQSLTEEPKAAPMLQRIWGRIREDEKGN